MVLQYPLQAHLKTLASAYYLIMNPCHVNTYVCCNHWSAIIAVQCQKTHGHNFIAAVSKDGK
jgi:hypothetical protein